MGILERELDRDHRRQGRGPDRDGQGRNDVRRQEGRKQEDRRPEDRKPEDRRQEKQNGGKGRQEREGSKKAPLRKREPVRLAGTVATLITAGALALSGYKVPPEQRIMLNDLLLPIIPVIVPVVAGFGVARSKVDSTATVERKMKEGAGGNRHWPSRPTWRLTPGGNEIPAGCHPLARRGHSRPAARPRLGPEDALAPAPARL